jgi:hypothetical protein
MMKRPSMFSRRNAERGEGRLKTVFWLLVLAYCIYIAFINVPIYLDAVNLKHTVEEVARSAGAENIAVDRVNQRISDLILRKYQVNSSEIKVAKDGPTLTLTLDTKREFDFVFYKYVWVIHQVSQGKYV